MEGSKQPRSFRLSAEAIEHLKTLARAMRRSQAEVIETLARERIAWMESEDLRARVDALEEEVKRLKEQERTDA